MSKKKPKTSVLQYEDEDNSISAYLVWIYPSKRIKKGARVVYFQASQAGTHVCYIHHEAPGSEVSIPKDEKYICKIATKALEAEGVMLVGGYDVFSDFGGW